MTWQTALIMTISTLFGALVASIVWNEVANQGWRRCRRDLDANHNKFMAEWRRIGEEIERHREVCKRGGL